MRLPHLPRDPGTRSLWRVNRTYWWSIGVLIVWVAARLNGVGGPPLAWPQGFTLILLLGAANLALRTLTALYNPQHTSGRLGWVFTTVDLTLIALGLRLTGGIESELWVLFFLVVVAETILANRGEARLVNLAAATALLAGTWSPDLKPFDFALVFGTRAFFLTAVSVITRRLRENIMEKEAEVANLRAELAAAGERTRLSRDIHDGIGNSLAAAVLRLEVGARVAEKQPESVGATLREEAQALRETMNAVRDWTFFTRPWSTQETSIPPSLLLEREIDRLSRRTGLPVTITGAGLLDAVPETVWIAALRITQEALTNTAKYAAATRAEVGLERDGDHLCLTFADDGRGFDPASCPPGIGLTAMRERTEALGGRFAVDSAPGRGTTLTACLPRAL